MVQPKLELLDRALVERIVGEAYQVLQEPGVRIHWPEALELLAEAGAVVDFQRQVVHIPEKMVLEALETAPSGFALYDVDGQVAVRYEGDHIQFNPGSAAIYLLDDPEKGVVRKPVTADFVKFIKLTEGVEQMDAQSTAMVCSDVPQAVADCYRLYLVLRYSRKPVVTGAFTVEGVSTMREMLVAMVGNEKALAERPLAVFDVCPSPPLLWSEITCANLMDCARYSIPAELVSMPLTGATGPVTLSGCLVQHCAESLSGLVIHQLVNPGAPIVYGGSPSAFNMRHGTTPMGAIETIMIDCAYAQIGKYLGLPTHAYLGLSDAKVVDTQVGFESAMGTIMGALAGVNMIAGAGMLDFESCQSYEKLVIDNDICGMARRLVRGVEPIGKELAVSLIREVGHEGNFLAARHTRQWYRAEHFFPSSVVDRATRHTWLESGGSNTLQRARERVEEVLTAYQPRDLPPEVEKELTAIMARAARKHGMKKLPSVA
ncbi:MAG: trimethylamine methyltransferase family protein [Anaerolineae bacterium]